MNNHSRRPWCRAMLFLALIGGAFVPAFGAGASPTGPFGVAHAAKGQSVLIGFVYDGDTPAGNYTENLTAAKASVQYVNRYLGGIGGRPIKLDVCSTNQVPATAELCVTQFENDRVVAAINGGGGVQGFVLPALAKAGIPVFAQESLDSSTLATPGIFIMLNNIASALAGPAALAEQLGVKTAAIVTADVPSAVGPLKAEAPIFYGKANVKVDIVPIPTTTADMTPQIQAEISTNNPGQFFVVGGPTFCASAIQAIKAVNFTGDTVMIPECIDTSTVQTAGSLQGFKVITATSTATNNSEYRLFSAIIRKWAPGTQLDGLSEQGYQTVMGFVRALSNLKSHDVTRVRITAALKTMPKTLVPLGGGVTYQCNGKQMPSVPTLCSTQVLVGTLAANGNVDAHGFSVLDVGNLLS
jgi:branched-chain amino acid transport system substrate-binding protein